jgi:predicted methyltransferase MtxX (methanogen marker protein 4)
MMITLITTTQAMPGKSLEAVVYAKEIAAVIKRITGRETVVSVAFGGRVGELAWIAQFDTMAQLEEALTKGMADREYANAIKKAEQLLIPGTTHNHIWKHV